MSIQVKNAKSITLGGQQVKQIKDTNGNVLWRKEPLPWWLDQTYLNSLTVDDVGTIKTVPVNGKEHRVRLIGVDHDDLATGGKAHTTWEFVDLISDANGYSLASLWQDTSSSSGSNYDYLNSTIRKNLTGNGSGTSGWYEKGSGTKSSTYSGKTVLSMLPSDLQSSLKTTRKKVYSHTSGSWALTNADDKLFLLATKEMGYSSSYAEDVATYSYYSGHTGQTDAIRIKQQVKGSSGALTSGTTITQSACGSGKSYAGYNSSTSRYGGISWLRSPNTNDSSIAWYVDTDGYLNYYGVYYFASAVAPAFCL